VSQRFAFLPATHEIAAQGWCFTAGATGARVELHPCDGRASQRWIETHGGFAADGLCLRVRGGSGAGSGAVIEAAACNGAVGQMWGLRGQVSYFDDELCLAASEMGGPLELATCGAAAVDETMIWWPRAGCAPLDCADLGASCGSFDDGCGDSLECGECAMEPSDLDGGVGELEECIPLECSALSCGSTPDGCGGTAECGPCPASDCGCRVIGARRGTGAFWLGSLMLLAALRRRRWPR
jgi:hypothetical protein